MAGYRRFIAYVYEYRKGKKENNCGFIKVEVRSSICTIEIHLHVEGLAAEEEARVFCFLRKEGLMNGILIGSCMTQTDRVDCLIETDALNMGDSGTALGKMGGMVILTKSGGFFGTEWDDQAIRPENFKEMKIGEETKRSEEDKQEETKQETAQPESPQNEMENNSDAENVPESEMEKENAEALGQVTPNDEVQNVEFSEETETTRHGETTFKTGQPVLTSEEIAAKHSEPLTSVSKEEPTTNPNQSDSESNRANMPEPIPGDALSAESILPVNVSEEPSAPVSGPDSSSDSTNTILQESKAKTDSELELNPASHATAAPSPTEEIHIQSIPSKPEKHSLPFGQPFCPFADGDLSQYWKIHPQDLVHFPRRQCGLRNNRFLQYGYYNFGHLLLCRRQNGKYILGVPGSYDQQEQFMAGMFGFPSFKESPLIKVPKGKGGYWYRTIDPPACR